MATVYNKIWQGNLIEWVMYGEFSQKLHSVGGDGELIINFFSETQTARQITISQEKFQMVLKDPSTGEILYTDEYTVIGHIMTKWLNGELQFTIFWTIEKT